MSFPPQVVWRYLKIIFTFADKSSLVYWIALLEFFCTLSYFALSFWAGKKIRISYGALMFFSLIIPTLTGTFQSMPRYLLHLFPAFAAMALLTEKSRWLFWGITLSFLALSFVFVALFTRGYFVA